MDEDPAVQRAILASLRSSRPGASQSRAHFRLERLQYYTSFRQNDKIKSHKCTYRTEDKKRTTERRETGVAAPRAPRACAETPTASSARTCGRKTPRSSQPHGASCDSVVEQGQRNLLPDAEENLGNRNPRRRRPRGASPAGVPSVARDRMFDRDAEPAHSDSGRSAGKLSISGEEARLERFILQDVVHPSGATTMDDVASLATAKRILEEAVVLPLQLPEVFRGVREPWKGVLLYGPPGTGKTLLASAVAHSAGARFFNCTAATLVSKWRGESEKLVRTLFRVAREQGPSVLFFDEIDALGSSRADGAEHEPSTRMKTELLAQMDGIFSKNIGTNQESSRPPVLVLAASNRPWALDEALRRRLERRVFIPLPDMEGRTAILELLLRSADVADDVNLRDIALKTEGFSGADLRALSREAAMNPLRRAVSTSGISGVRGLQAKGALKLEVSHDDLCEALRSMRPSVDRDTVARLAAWRKKFGAE